MSYKSISEGKFELLEEICNEYLKLMKKMQVIEASMSDLEALMNDLDIDVTVLVQSVKVNERGSEWFNL